MRGGLFLNQQGIISTAVSPYKLQCSFTAANETSLLDYVPEVGTYFGASGNGLIYTKIYNNIFVKGNSSTSSGFTVTWTPTGPVTTIEADINVFVVNIQGLQGLFFRGTSEQVGYACMLYSGAARIYRMSHVGDLTEIANVAFAFTYNVTYHFKIILTGDLIDFYIDDVLIASATDGTYQGNIVGYRGWYTVAAASNQTLMDNLVAY